MRHWTRSFSLPALACLPLVLSACPADPPAGNETSTSLGSETADTSESNDTNDTTDTEGEGGSFCGHECDVDTDCLINGQDLGYVCNSGTCFDPDADASCSTDEECVAVLSGWAFGTECTAGGGECEPAMQVCLDIEGEGHCAVAPGEFITCDQLGFDEIPTTDIDGNDTVVCGKADAECNLEGGGYCFSPCGSNDDCASPSAPMCNVGTGLCECSSDADCATLNLPGVTTCNAGICGCGTDADCVGAGSGDVCQTSGQCGCSGDDACSGVENGFDGGMIVCKEF